MTIPGHLFLFFFFFKSNLSLMSGKDFPPESLMLRLPKAAAVPRRNAELRPRVQTGLRSVATRPNVFTKIYWKWNLKGILFFFFTTENYRDNYFSVSPCSARCTWELAGLCLRQRKKHWLRRPVAVESEALLRNRRRRGLRDFSIRL